MHSNFTYYKEDPFVKESDSLLLNGAYATSLEENSLPVDLLFFYKDGTCKVAVWVSLVDTAFWLHPEYSLSYFKNNDFNTNKHLYWGHYIVRKDSIFIQTFHRFDQSLIIIRDVIQLRGVIKNDSTLLINKMFYDWSKWMLHKDARKNEQYNPPLKYKFYPTTLKPDSSFVWFRNKKWYRTHVNKK